MPIPSMPRFGSGRALPRFGGETGGLDRAGTQAWGLFRNGLELVLAILFLKGEDGCGAVRLISLKSFRRASVADGLVCHSPTRRSRRAPPLECG